MLAAALRRWQSETRTQLSQKQSAGAMLTLGAQQTACGALRPINVPLISFGRTPIIISAACGTESSSYSVLRAARAPAHGRRIDAGRNASVLAQARH